VAKFENLKLYLKQIHSKPELTEKEKEKLFRLIMKSGKKAEEAKMKIVQNNLSLVVNLAKKYYYPGMNMEFLDFIEEGNIGLVKAVEKFDYRKGFKFSTYASWWIEKHFQEAVLKSRSVVQIPEKTWRYLKKIEQTTTELLHQTGHAPNIKELSKEIDISIGELRDTIHSAMKMKNIRSLDYYVDEDQTRTLESIISKEEFADDELVEKMSKKEQVENLLKNLTEEERCVLQLRFALDGNEKYTFKEIGEKLKISPSKAKEVLDRTIKKLKRIALINRSE
jgi:RNA polymerase sigma factor (sigma-70 family)